MADVWEDMYGLDKNNYNDNALDKDGDGYTNLEEFINGTQPTSATVTDPVVTDPAPIDPVVTDPAPTDPVVTDPAPTDPVLTDPAANISLLDFPYTLVDEAYILDIVLNADETTIEFTTTVPDSGITF